MSEWDELQETAAAEYREKMLEGFNTRQQQQAMEGDYVFIPANTIEYVKRNGDIVGKVQRVDVSNWFGLALFQVGAFVKDTDGWRLLGSFGQSVDVIICDGGQRAVYDNVMRKPEFERAVDLARETVLGEAR